MLVFYKMKLKMGSFNAKRTKIIIQTENKNLGPYMPYTFTAATTQLISAVIWKKNHSTIIYSLDKTKIHKKKTFNKNSTLNSIYAQK